MSIRKYGTADDQTVHLDEDDRQNSTIRRTASQPWTEEDTQELREENEKL